MDIMNSPEGFILRFLKKKRDGMFDRLDKAKDSVTVARYVDADGKAKLKKLKVVLIERGTLSEGQFDSALASLENDGYVDKEELTEEGLALHESETAIPAAKPLVYPN
jgi:hypothetical protein